MNIPGVSGSLLSHDAWDSRIRHLFAPALDECGRARTRLRAWHARVRAEVGPTAAARTVFDRIAAPLFAQLGYRVIPLRGNADALAASLEVAARKVAVLFVTAWGRDLSVAWREVVHHGIAQDVSWCFCVNGPLLRIIDSRRTYSRRSIELDLQAAVEHSRAFEILWALLRPDPRPGTTPLGALGRAVELSEQHRASVRESLQEGVQDALLHLEQAFRQAAARRRRGQRGAAIGHDAFGEALIVIYRILFLLFAEARGLVPRWHPTYRDGYTIEALRESVELLVRPRGLWQALQAMSRLAHKGCRLGPLYVPPFNGHLFAPGEAPLAEATALDDGVVRRAVLALTTRRVKAGRVRVAYGDLGVEQLGGIYERLLDFTPATGRKPGERDAPARKRTGSFYTPRPLTEFLVRRTLAPLVRDASPEQILGLRIVDPAMGSGAFLIAACRYLSAAYEAALIREGGLSSSDISDGERVCFRRAVAQQCLFGVDVNPMAVQLGRLSVWLTTLSAERPLTFLDHRLRVGNSLVGARVEDLLRQPPSTRLARRPASLPLFEDAAVSSAIQHAVGIRLALAAESDDTIEQVRGKERALATVAAPSALGRWKAVADLWCSVWFRKERRDVPFGALADALLGRFDTLPARTAGPLLAESRMLAEEHRFFHWPLEFPEIFYSADGSPRGSAGFDAVIGNPPWEMLRGDSGEGDGRETARESGARLTAFARTSGIYALTAKGHANLYQLFLERALGLLRPGGRLGLILPGGFAVDRGSSGLRRALLDRTSVDGLVSLENRDGIFPIHRGVKFLLLTATEGGGSSQVKCRFGITKLAELERLPDTGFNGEAITLTRTLLERIGGDNLTLPDLRTPLDLEIVSALAFRWPALEDATGWGARFGRELNASDDRPHFVDRSRTRTCLPVVEGKHLTPFAVDTGAAVHGIPASTAARLLDADSSFRRPRLAYRDVASSTNRLSLIAAIVPAGAITTHTVFCLRSTLDLDSQNFLCGVFNSYVANYFVRCQINTHLGLSVVARLPVPRPPRTSPAFQTIGALAASLARHYTDEDGASLQAHVARLYDLSERQFARVLDTFPLVNRGAREAAAAAFCDIVL